MRTQARGVCHFQRASLQLQLPRSLPPFPLYSRPRLQRIKHRQIYPCHPSPKGVAPAVGPWEDLESAIVDTLVDAGGRLGSWIKRASVRFFTPDRREPLHPTEGTRANCDVRMSLAICCRFRFNTAVRKQKTAESNRTDTVYILTVVQTDLSPDEAHREESQSP